jgi:alcohol dehydrogenase (NADP+)
MLANAYAAHSAVQPLRRTTVQRRDVGPHDVLIEIAYTGICHSDISHVRAQWRAEVYPLVPGHEIVGVVAAVGRDVVRYAVSDRVAVGCLVDSCRRCEPCLTGTEQYCLAGPVLTYGSVIGEGEITQGGYSSHVVVDEHFVLRLPDALDLAAAAPLLCAGITAYSPLRHWSVGPGSRVAVVGLGGLGHLAVKVAHALGARVCVLSGSASKGRAAARLGAEAFRCMRDHDPLAGLTGTFDLVLNTASGPVDLDDQLGLLTQDGTLVVVGVPGAALPLNVTTLFGRRGSIAGSKVGGIRQTQELLDWAAAHQITADVEVIPASAVNDAYQRVLAGDVRFRFVIDIASLSS